MVGIGLLIEYWREIIDCFVTGHLPSWPLIGGLMVTLGVFGEVWFSRLALKAAEEIQERADSDVATANERSAQAFERASKAEQAAAEANLERIRLEEKLSDRRISAEQRLKIVGALAKRAGESVHVDSLQSAGGEGRIFADDIIAVFKEAGWILPQHPAWNWGFKVAIEPFRGLVLLYKMSAHEDASELATFVHDTFVGAGIRCSSDPKASNAWRVGNHNVETPTALMIMILEK